eukprot:g20772.t1
MTQPPNVSMVLVDGSLQGRQAFESAMKHKEKGEVLHIVHAVETVRPGPVEEPREVLFFDQLNESIKKRATGLLKGYSDMAQERGASPCKVALLEDDSPKDAVLRYAEEQKVGTIFVGTRGLGPVKAFFLGSFSQYVVQHAHCNVLVSKPESNGDPRRPWCHSAPAHLYNFSSHETAYICVLIILCRGTLRHKAVDSSTS